MRSILVALFTCIASSVAAAAGLKVGAAGPVLATTEKLVNAYNHAYPGRNVEMVPRKPDGKVVSMGSKGAVKNAAMGEYEGTPFVGFASEVAQDLRSLRPQTIEVARTPLLFAVRKNGPAIDNITREQVIDIYARRLREWSPGQPISLVRRPLSESDNNILVQHIPELKPLIAALVSPDPDPDLTKGLPKVADDAQESARQCTTYPGAFCTSSLNQIVTEKLELKPLKFNGVEPSLENLASNKYLMMKPVLIVTGRNVTPEMQHFIDFVRTSKASRQIFMESGHVFRGGG